MTPDSINRMIEQASPQERRQMKAWINVYLDPMRKLRRAMAEAEQKQELGEEHVNHRNDIESRPAGLY